MYAVIKAGGKQHRVKAGDVIEVELMHAKDDSVRFQPLLVVDDDNKTHVGKELSKAVVTGKLVGEQKGEKVKVFKYRNKSGYARHQGHRQMYTLVEIGEIKLPGAPAAKKAADRDKDAGAEAAAEKPAAKSTAAESTSAKSTASKTAAAKTAAAAEPAAAEQEDEATEADAAPAETPPAEVAEVAAEAETGPDGGDADDASGDSEADSDRS